MPPRLRWPRTLQQSLPEWIDDLVDPGAPYPSDEDRMDLVLRLARENIRRGTGGPFGAAVFEADTGALVGVGVNLVAAHRNSCLHAEVMALMVAQAAVGSHLLGLPGGPVHELVTSCEPCAMCLGAVPWSGVRRVIMGALREDAQALGFDEGPVFPESYAYLAARGLQFTRGVRRAEGRAVLEEYVARGMPTHSG